MCTGCKWHLGFIAAPPPYVGHAPIGALILILDWILWDSSPITHSFQRWQVQCLYLSLRAICPQIPLNKIFLVYGYIGITIVMIDSCDDRNITMETHKWFTVGIQLVWWLSNITRTSSWKRLNVWLSNTQIIPSVSDLSSTQLSIWQYEIIMRWVFDGDLVGCFCMGGSRWMTVNPVGLPIFSSYPGVFWISFASTTKKS